MALVTGKQLGPYEILAPLGAGGMGEVYRAKDTRLDRTVAVKVLPTHLSDNPELKQRFDREARAISALTHPHICTLHDVGHQDGIDYLVMEYLDGESLAARLAKGALPIDQVLRFGREIASALDKAHRSGVIHRDLKPGNIMLTKTGAKLLDFGLAKGVPLAAGEPTALTITQPLTGKGTLVGTFQYMSPEQLEGKEADARTDIFAFGAVLYEMATGKRAFEGKSQASLIAAIMNHQPAPISQIQPMTPPALDHLVRTCLAKDPDDRIQTAHDILLQLQWIAEGGSQAGLPAPLLAGRRTRHQFWIASTLALLAISLALSLLLFRREPVATRIIRASILPPENASFLSVGDLAGPVAVSPDGTALAFTTYGSDGTPKLWVRSLAGETPRLLPGTDGASFPFWSPDSRSIGYFTLEKLRTVDVTGGPPVTVCDAGGGRGGTWNKDGVIVFSPELRAPLYQVTAAGGVPRELTKLDEARHDSHRWPSFCKDGKHFVYLAVIHGSSEAEENAIFWGSLDGGTPQLVMRTSTNALLAGDHILFMREGSLLAARFDGSTGRLSGEPSVIATDVTDDVTVWRGGFSSSENGVLAYHRGQATSAQGLIRFDRNGKELGRIGEAEDFTDCRLSPDGKRLVASISGRSTEVWVFDVARSTKTRVSFERGGSNVTPVWTGDGKSIVYSNIWLSNKERTHRLIRRPAAGGDPEILLESRDEKWPTDVSRDGKYLLYTQGHYVGGKPSDIMLLPLDGKREPSALIKTPFEEDHAKFSPDGRWASYESTESGRFEVYVAPFNPPTTTAPASETKRSGKWQVSTSGGAYPAWRADGKEIVYLGLDRKLISVEVNGDTENFEIGAAKPLFIVNVPAGLDPFDIAADGQWFVVNTSTLAASTPISLIVNWSAALKQ